MSGRTYKASRTHVIDPDGNVWPLFCQCDAHEGKGRVHAARPIGNVRNDKALAERMGVTK